MNHNMHLNCHGLQHGQHNQSIIHSIIRFASLNFLKKKYTYNTNVLIFLAMLLRLTSYTHIHTWRKTAFSSAYYQLKILRKFTQTHCLTTRKRLLAMCFFTQVSFDSSYLVSKPIVNKTQHNRT